MCSNKGNAFGTDCHFGRRSTCLCEHHHLVGSTRLAEGIMVGDIVIVEEGDMRRNQWGLGKKEGLIVGSGGVTREATVKVGERDKRSAIIQRPAQKLYPLEPANRNHFIRKNQASHSTCQGVQ